MRVEPTPKPLARLTKNDGILESDELTPDGLEGKQLGDSRAGSEVHPVQRARGAGGEDVKRQECKERFMRYTNQRSLPSAVDNFRRGRLRRRLADNPVSSFHRFISSSCCLTFQHPHRRIMPARTRPKAQPSGPKTNSSSSVTTPPPPPSLPLREYFALLSYHSALLIASFLFLPRSTKGTRLSQRSSADRPEHPFLTPLTANPLRTMAWHVVGLAVCVTWWGQHLRTWRAGSKTRDDSPASRQKRRRALADVSECLREAC
jgi:hypothetical protein